MVEASQSGSEKLIFLPGASGNAALWKPVSDGLSHRGARRFFSWPGFGGAAADPSVTGLTDLVERVVSEITEPVVLFALVIINVVQMRMLRRNPDE